MSTTVLPTAVAIIFAFFVIETIKKCSLTKHTIDTSFEQISSLHRLDEERDQDEYAPNFMQLSPMKDPKKQ